MGGRGGRGGKRNAVSFSKPAEPAFIRRMKEQLGYKESATLDTKVIVGTQNCCVSFQ